MTTAQVAGEILAKLDQQLNCSICLETYTDPKLLRCGHYFCLQCLAKLLRKDERQRFYLRCPTCRTETRIPNTHVAGLQPAFHINDLKSIRDAGRGALMKRASPCQEHPEKELEFYCERCNKLTCPFCLLKYGTHYGHDHELVSIAIENTSNQLQVLRNEVDDKIKVYSDCMKNLDSNIEDVDNWLKCKRQKFSLQGTPDGQVRLLHITQQEEASKNHKEELEALRIRGSAIESEIESCKNLLTKCDEINESGEKIFALKQAREDYDAATIKLSAICEEVVQMQPLCLLDPLKCTAEGNGIHFAAIGKKSTVTLNILSYTSKPYQEEVKVECELVCGLGMNKVQGRVERKGPSQYQISYRPTIAGNHFLYIRANGVCIKKKAFEVEVIESIPEIQESPIHIISSLQGPSGVAVNRFGEVFVLERDRYRITVFSCTGEKVCSIPIQKLSKDKLCGLNSITIDDKGKVLTTFINFRQILRNGIVFQTLFRLHSPKCIAFSEYNKKIYVAINNNRILVLNPNLESFTIFSEHREKFSDVRGLACDPAGNVYAADCKNNCVQVFTSEGEFLRKFGDLDKPVSIAVDHTGIVYVCEQGRSRISFFTPGGQIITSFGQRGSKPGEFQCLGGIAVSAAGILYVYDEVLNCVQAFSIIKPTLTSQLKLLFFILSVLKWHSKLQRVLLYFLVSMYLVNSV